MKKTLVGFGVLASSIAFISWGTFGHEHINKASIMALPMPMQTFFFNHSDFLVQESTIPDLRKYTLKDKSENPRHFIDLENFGIKDSLPATLGETKAKYDDKFLSENGILPWYMEEMMEKLTNAFKEKRKTEILFLAGDLGHYMGDAHMPLHTSVNHDGQLTNQKGIHALWEAQMPEMFGKNYNFYAGEATFISDVHKDIWRIIFESHRLKDTLLAVDLAVRKLFSEDKMYKHDKDGKILKNKFKSWVFSDEYANALNKNLNGMVEKQMRLSAKDVANFWFTAWVNAGKPDLSDLDSQEITKKNAQQLQEEIKLFKQGKLFGVVNENEF